MRKTLVIAALYYFILGISAIFWPQSWYALSGIHPTSAEVLIDSLGAVMLALSFGALLASMMPQTQWGIVVVLFFANFFDCLMVLRAQSNNQISQLPAIGFVALDLVWLGVFGAILYKIYRAHLATDSTAINLEAALGIRPIGSGSTLAELSDQQPLVVVLVRHSGCTFCRAHLSELVKEQENLLRGGARLAVVSMSSIEDLQKMMQGYPIPNVLMVSDPSLAIYKALGATKGSILQLFGPKELWHALVRGALFKHGIGEVKGDPSQLGGTFMIKNRRLIFSRPARSASEICPLPEVFAKAEGV